MISFRELIAKVRKAKRHLELRKGEMMCVVYRVEDISKHLSEKKPFFRMRSGGVYAVALTDGEPTHFVRVDKDRRPRRERKRARRAARKLAEVTI